MKNKKYTYYFAFGDVDHEYDEYWDDDNNWGIALANSAERINILESKNRLEFDNFNKMIDTCVKNIISGNSRVFNYDGDISIDVFDIDYEDVIYEMINMYKVKILMSTIPLIWGRDCWEWDKNYSENNPPKLWRVNIY